MMSSRVQRIGFVRQNARFAHLAKGEDLLLARSYGQYCPIDYWTDQSFDAVAGQREDGFQNRVVVIERDAADGCDALKSNVLS
jgi:hypothetical protein